MKPIKDVQLFRQISIVKKTEYSSDEELETKAAIMLSKIELMEPNDYPGWKNEEPKTTIFMQSGASLTVLVPFEDMLNLWANYLAQTPIAITSTAN